MKIIVTVHQFLPEFSSGTELIALGIAKELQGRGHDVTVVTGFPDPRPLADDERFDRYSYDGLRVERFRHSAHPMGGQRVVTELTYDNHLFARAFDRLLAEVEPDVVHFVHLARLSAALVGPCVARGIPTVFTATDFWPVCPYSQLRLAGNEICDGPDALGLNCIRHFASNMAGHPISVPGIASRAPGWMLELGVRAAVGSRLPMAPAFVAEVRALVERQPFLRRQLNLIDRVLAPSRIMERKLTEGGIDADRVEFLPYGINVEGMTRRDDRGSEPVLRLGFIGSVAEHKGVEVAVNAVKRLHPSFPVELSIHGAPGDNAVYQAYYRHIQALAGTDPRITVHPPFHNREVKRVLAGLDALIVPSLWHENTPLVVYEAFAAGCPVIASRVEGIAEVVRHEENGLLFGAGDSVSLAGAIARVARDRPFLRALASRTRPPLSVPDHVSRLEEIYEELLGARSLADEVHAAV
jgi:glycosyltransferase involved in cell wall biosynthesis